jgi:hypothetical protein
MPRAGLQERIESARGGRLLVSTFVVSVVAGMAVLNLPDGAFGERAAKVAAPYVNALGVGQSWTMFAPYPRSEVLYLEARATHADGSVSTWRPPSRGALIGGYSDSHWRKYVEHAAIRHESNPDGWRRLWEPLARYVAREHGRDGSPVTSVTLVKRSGPIPPPGTTGPRRAPLRDEAYYTLRPAA